jgi:DNA-binding CsgD family transcriptional regulator
MNGTMSSAATFSDRGVNGAVASNGLGALGGAAREGFAASYQPGERVLAVHAAGRDADPEEAAQIWRALLAGRWTIIDHCDHEGKRFLLAVANAPKSVECSSLTAREVQILARVALRHSLKLVSYELGLSHSTVSGQLQSALRKLRLSSVAEAVRLLGAGAPHSP